MLPSPRPRCSRPRSCIIMSSPLPGLSQPGPHLCSLSESSSSRPPSVSPEPSASKTLQLARLRAAIAYIQRLQHLCGGSVDGELLPCLARQEVRVDEEEAGGGEADGRGLHE